MEQQNIFMKSMQGKLFLHKKTINKYLYCIVIWHMGGENKCNGEFAKWKSTNLLKQEKLFSDFWQDFTIAKKYKI